MLDARHVTGEPGASPGCSPPPSRPITWLKQASKQAVCTGHRDKADKATSLSLASPCKPSAVVAQMTSWSPSPVACNMYLSVTSPAPRSCPRVTCINWRGVVILASLWLPLSCYQRQATPPNVPACLRAYALKEILSCSVHCSFSTLTAHASHDSIVPLTRALASISGD